MDIDNITETTLNIIKGITSIQIFKFDFWFQSNPTDLISFFVTFIIFLGVTFFGVGVLVYNRWKIGNYPPKNKILKPFGIGLVITGAFGLFFSVLNWQGVSFLGVRFFLLGIFLVGVVWFLFSLALLKRKAPDQVVKYETGLIKRRYFSKKAK
jgi:hypothetical protein